MQLTKLVSSTFALPNCLLLMVLATINEQLVGTFSEVPPETQLRTTTQLLITSQTTTQRTLGEIQLWEIYQTGLVSCKVVTRSAPL